MDARDIVIVPLIIIDIEELVEYDKKRTLYDLKTERDSIK